MKYLEKLLEGVEVEWINLGSVADYEQPTKYLVSSANYKDEYKTPVLTAGKTFILGYTDETEGIYEASKNPAIIFDDFTTANKWVDFNFKAKSSAMKIITSKEESKTLLKYIYYWLNTLPSGLVEGDHKRQWISNYSNKQIPIPPLKVQKEIVRILDIFSALTAELTAELTARKKQYAFYREELLTFVDEVEWINLGSVADYEQPTKYLVSSANYKDEYKTPVLTAGKTFILGYTDETEGIYEASKNPAIIFDDFTTANKWVDFNFKAKSSAMKIITSKEESKTLLKYIYYWLNTLPSGLVEGDHKRQWISNYSNKQIPIPPLKVQQEIVRILDTFTELTAELTAELTNRKKQYEYYRDMLLTFPKDNTES